MKARALALLSTLAPLALAGTLAAPAWAAPPKPKKPPPTIPEGGVEVVVVESAGTQAYVKPGAASGIRRGSKVTIAGRAYDVVSSTSTYAVIEVGDRPPKDDDHGVATTAAEQAEAVKELKPPRPASAFAGVWPPAVAPAASQSPKPVPLGDADRDRRYDVRFLAVVGGFVPLDGKANGLLRSEVGVRAHAEPFAAPLAVDLDGSVQRWFGPGLDARDGDSSRPLLFVRELFVRYGRLEQSYAGIGRMRYAASTLGALDGARGKVALGKGFGVAAFGGILPHPLSGAPSLDAQRFGLEGTYSRPDLSIRPEAALVAHGSMFDGSLDERRLSGVVGIFPGRSRLGGHFEVSSFDSNNPWKANPIELTAAGIDGSVRLGPVQLGARGDVNQPIRSRWLASFLPASWFCLTQPVATGPETCDARASTRAVGVADASLELDRLLVAGGATVTRDLGISSYPTMFGGFGTARVSRIARRFRVEASGNYASSTFVDAYGVSGGPGVTLFHDDLDLSGYYRYGSISYRTSSSGLQQHGFGVFAMLMPSSVVSFTLQSEAMVGDDANLLMALFTALWRPRL